MKKLILIAVLGHFIAGHSSAQSTDSLNQPSPSTKLERFVVKFTPDVNRSGMTLPFSRIEVVDARFDTTKLGFHRPRFSKKAAVLTTDSGLYIGAGHYLNHYYQDNLDKTSGNQLLVCIKKLWLTDFDRSELKDAEEDNDRSFLYIKTEVYLQSGEQYFPVQRLDTVFVTKRIARYSAVDFMQEVLKYTINQLQTIDVSYITKKRSVDRRRIDSFNVSKSYAVFQADTPQRGVYLSFEEFKNNRPSYKEFDMKFEKLTDILYVKESDGKFYVKRNVWGFFNGKSFFIRMGLNYFPLFRHGQTMEFFGSNSIERRGLSLPNLLGTAVPLAYSAAIMAVDDNTKMNSKLTRIRPFQIDMETGQFY